MIGWQLVILTLQPAGAEDWRMMLWSGVILTSIQILSAPAATAAPTFAKFTAPTFSQESDTTRAGWL